MNLEDTNHSTTSSYVALESNHSFSINLAQGFFEKISKKKHVDRLANVSKLGLTTHNYNPPNSLLAQ